MLTHRNSRASGEAREGVEGEHESRNTTHSENLRHAGSVPGEGTQREYTVCKLIDTTTCIGCKACEVACMEWNDLPFGETVFDNTYQTMPETRWNYWNLILFNEHEREDGSLMWLMRKNQCMHCAEPGCLAACPSDGAIVQYTNGIVDFQQDKCIGCGYCITGCPFNIRSLIRRQSEFTSALCARIVSARDLNRRASSRAHGLPALWQQGRHEVPGRTAGKTITRPLQLPKAECTIPGRGWHRRDLCAA